MTLLNTALFICTQFVPVQKNAIKVVITCRINIFKLVIMLKHTCVGSSLFCMILLSWSLFHLLEAFILEFAAHCIYMSFQP